MTRLSDERLAVIGLLPEKLRKHYCVIPSPREMAEAAPDKFANETADAIDALLAELKALKAEREWRPIETAPKDGTRILLAYKGGIQQGYWLDNSDKQWPWSGWKICDQQVPVNSYHKPEAWMPIPSYMAATEEQPDD